MTLFQIPAGIHAFQVNIRRMGRQIGRASALWSMGLDQMKIGPGLTLSAPRIFLASDLVSAYSINAIDMLGIAGRELVRPDTPGSRIAFSMYVSRGDKAYCIVSDGVFYWNRAWDDVPTLYCGRQAHEAIKKYLTEVEIL
jgi:hypothetical protein